MSVPFVLLAQMRRPILATFLRLSLFSDIAQELLKKKERESKRRSFKSTTPLRIISDSIKQRILLLPLEVTAYRRWEHGLKVALSSETLMFHGFNVERK